MLLTINAHLLNSIKYTSWIDNYDSFYELRDKKHVKIADEAEGIIASIYSVNVALDCLRDGLKCKTWPKCINYDRITKLNKSSVRYYYEKQVFYKSGLILLVCEEIKIIQQLIEVNVHKHNKILMNAKEMDILT